MSVEDDERSGRRSIRRKTENVEKLRELIREDLRRTMHEIAESVLIIYGVCQAILTENLTCASLLPSLLPES
jgi:hypothetical protein